MPQRSRPRVVVTGMGAVTPLGNTLESYWQGLMAGTSGAGPITQFDATHFDTRFACEVKSYDPLLHMNRKEIQRMDLFAQYAMSSAAMAIEDAGINFETLNRNRIGVIFGSGIGGMWTNYHQQNNLYQRNGIPDRISPFFIPMLISDIAAGLIAMRWGLKGPNYATVSACATSSHSLADALMLLQRGSADMILAGGSEAVITPMAVGGFNAAKALSTRNDSPETASRPFDVDRDGFVLGEGGGILVLETLEHAQSRGARIYAEFSGIGLTDDAYHMTAPAPGGEGAARAMQAAVEDAGLLPTDIDYINMHGTSTTLGDIAETQAIKTVFGDHARTLAASSTKSMTGHLLGAAGAIEAVATVKAIVEGTLPPTINLVNQDPECDLFYVPNTPVERKVRAAISNTFGFGGHNASLVFQAFED